MEKELAWSVVKNDGHRGPVKFPSQVPHKQCRLMWDGTHGKLTIMRRIPKSVYNHGFKKCQSTPHALTLSECGKPQLYMTPLKKGNTDTKDRPAEKPTRNRSPA